MISWHAQKQICLLLVVIYAFIAHQLLQVSLA